MGDGLVRFAAGELATQMPDARDAIRRAAQAIAAKYDYNEYGGAAAAGRERHLHYLPRGQRSPRRLNAVRVARGYASCQANSADFTALLAKSDKG